MDDPVPPRHAHPSRRRRSPARRRDASRSRRAATTSRATTNYEIVLTVTDSTGLSHVDVGHDLSRTRSTSRFDTVPSGPDARRSTGSASRRRSCSTTLKGFQHTINAPDQTSGGTSYTFASWSDGGAQSHTHRRAEREPELHRRRSRRRPAPGLVAAYSFNEGTGTTVADASGNGNGGTHRRARPGRPRASTATRSPSTARARGSRSPTRLARPDRRR